MVTPSEGMIVEVNVYLFDEGEDVWRPVPAVKRRRGYEIIGAVPDDEVWQFGPGDLVTCEEREFEDGIGLVAVSRLS